MLYFIQCLDYSPEYQLQQFEKHATLLSGIIYIVNDCAEGLQHAGSAIKAMPKEKTIILGYSYRLLLQTIL